MSLNGLEPADYLGSFEPEVLRSQWIPDDPKLWQVENYPQFLAARRELLAAAANDFLDQLLAGTRPWHRLEAMAVSPESDESDARAAQIAALVDELVGMGYAEAGAGRRDRGPGDGPPAGGGRGVLVGRPAARARARRWCSSSTRTRPTSPGSTELGCEVFTSVDALRGYVQRRNEVASGERDSESGVVAPEPDPVQDEPEEASGAFDRAVLDVIERSPGGAAATTRATSGSWSPSTAPSARSGACWPHPRSATAS